MLFEWVRQSWLRLSIHHGTAIMKPLWIGIAFIAFALVAALFDIRERRIPNVLNLFGLGLFLALIFAKVYSTAAKKYVVRWLPTDTKKGTAIVVFVHVSSILLCAVMSLF
ncbi:hypothetical protein [Ferroacidibacillus organovorans]|uniref:Uncharacterized protein n=2 Tax=Ferroacidibacillus organovorans TaxID=1765683 RepID=A0A101XRI1_9BACL|nr:hypothetical protein [Ferroacidibacillus organovorans]KUO96191.1 hypothetical protein ATW55_14780 [Ferroacidibacillus organovorans]OPG14861.1 hypothetical protein B2M26_14825 [Ferroacidibacillus organovorans]